MATAKEVLANPGQTWREILDKVGYAPSVSPKEVYSRKGFQDAMKQMIPHHLLVQRQRMLLDRRIIKTREFGLDVTDDMIREMIAATDAVCMDITPKYTFDKFGEKHQTAKIAYILTYDDTRIENALERLYKALGLNEPDELQISADPLRELSDAEIQRRLDEHKKSIQERLAPPKSTSEPRITDDRD